MPRALSEAMKTALRSNAPIAALWLFEFQTDEKTLRACSWSTDVDYDGETFIGLKDKVQIAGEIRIATGLVPEPLTLSLDGNDQYDDATLVGTLLDSTWHQRRIIVRNLLYIADEWLLAMEWFGRMDTVDVSEEIGGTAIVAMTCEGGTFRAKDRTFHTLTAQNQQDRNAGDGFLKNIAIKPSQDIPFGVSPQKIPGTNNGR